MKGRTILRELNAAADLGADGDLTPRQRLILCLALMRGGVSVKAELLDRDLQAWRIKNGEPTAANVGLWIQENRSRIVYGLASGQRGRRAAH
jgi:hypothetical protein